MVNNNASKGTLVIVGDSYTHCMERFFAESYRDVYKLDPRHAKFSLTKFLASHHVDDILFLAAPTIAMSKPFLDFLK